MHFKQIEDKIKELFVCRRGFITLMALGGILLVTLLGMTYSYVAKRHVENVNSVDDGYRAQQAAEAGVYYALENTRIAFQYNLDNDVYENPAVMKNGRITLNGTDDKDGFCYVSAELMPDQGDKKVRVKYTSEGTFGKSVRRLQGVIAHSDLTTDSDTAIDVDLFDLLHDARYLGDPWKLPSDPKLGLQVDWNTTGRTFSSNIAVFGPKLRTLFDASFRLQLNKTYGLSAGTGTGVAITYGASAGDAVDNTNRYSLQFDPGIENMVSSGQLPGGLLVMKKEIKNFSGYSGHETKPVYQPFQKNASGAYTDEKTDIAAIPLDARAGAIRDFRRDGQTWSYQMPGLKQQVEAQTGQSFSLLGQEHEFRIRVQQDPTSKEYRHYVYVDNVLVLHFVDRDKANSVKWQGNNLGFRVWNANVSFSSKAKLNGMRGVMIAPYIEKWSKG